MLTSDRRLSANATKLSPGLSSPDEVTFTGNWYRPNESYRSIIKRLFFTQCIRVRSAQNQGLFRLCGEVWSSDREFSIYSGL